MDQDQVNAQIAAMSELIATMTQYVEMRDSKKLTLRRRAKNFFVIDLPRFDQRTGEPVEPGEIKLNRDGAADMAKGLDEENKRLLARVEANKVAMQNLTVVLPADMDALDKAAGG